MTCAEARPLLQAYADGELDLVHSLNVQQHASACADCAAAVQRAQMLRSALRSAELAYRAPAALPARLRRALRGAGGETREPRPPRTWVWKGLALATAAAAVLLLVLQPLAPSRHDRLLDEAVAAHVRSLMASHLTDVASTDQHTVKPWFAGRIDFTPPVKDLSAAGFELVGGRLDYLQDRPVAALVYRHKQHLVNVFAWPRRQGSAWTTEPSTRRGYSIVERNAGDLHLSAVSDLNLEELQQFVARLAE